MGQSITIRPLEPRDIPFVTSLARAEGFAPGVGDVAIYRSTDRQGLWVGWLGDEPVGCIAGVRYNAAYGFIGLFLVKPERRGRGFGVQLWRHAMDYLADLPCIGLEAATDRIDDYAGWGFAPATPTTRWHGVRPSPPSESPQTLWPWRLLEGSAIPEAAVQHFHARREPSPRPHFLSQWLHHPAGTVLALVDARQTCRGFGRIRPCLLREGEGWRIGPLVAESPAAAARLLEALRHRHEGPVLIDAPGGNVRAAPLLEELGFRPTSGTLRMYRGTAPTVPLDEVYGLACLELG